MHTRVHGYTVYTVCYTKIMCAFTAKLRVHLLYHSRINHVCIYQSRINYVCIFTTFEKSRVPLNLYTSTSMEAQRHIGNMRVHGTCTQVQVGTCTAVKG